MAKKTVKCMIEERMGMPFRQIVANHLKKGMGRYEASRVIEELCESRRGPDDPQIRIVSSTVWNLIKDGIRTGDLCEVKGNPESPPLFQFNKRTKKKNNTVKNTMLEIHYECSNCENKWSERKEVDPKVICLRTTQCPECERKRRSSFCKVSATFDYKGKTIRKQMRTEGGRLRETVTQEKNQNG